MEYKAVHVVGAQMFERTSQRLRNLSRQRGGGIIRQAIVLAALVGEFGLQEKIGACNDSRAIGSSQSFADSSLGVVTALVCGINPSKPCTQGEFGERGSAVFFPGSAV